MNALVLPLESVRLPDAHRVGGKAAPLGELLAGGFPVPPGVCVTVDAFWLALADRRADIDAILAGVDVRDAAAAQTVARAIASRVADLTMPPTVSHALREAIPGLGDSSKPFAVRSSAVGEDGADMSFAGQYATSLGVTGEAAIRAAIATCWRSFFSAHAIAARAGAGKTGGMAVLIQPLIQAECAGVCFTVDPVQAQRDRLVVNSAWGLGAGVVDGSVATDTAWVQRRDLGVAQRRIAEKPERLRFSMERGVQREPVLIEQRRAACLPDAWLERIAQFGVALEAALGQPQDVEWAIAGERLWILQSRPISGLPSTLRQPRPFPIEWQGDADARSLWRADGEDGVSPVMLPLEQDHFVALSGTNEETCRLIGVERNARSRCFNGRAFSQRIPMPWTPADRRVRWAATQDLQDRLQREGRTNWDVWGPEIVTATERLRAFDREAADGPALADHLEDALAIAVRHWMLHPLCSAFRPGRPFFDAFARLSGVNEAEVEAAAYRLLDGGETPLSRLVDGLYDLAVTARRHAGVASVIADAPSDAMSQLQVLPDAQAFLDQLTAFLDVYGERVGFGWGSIVTLRTPTWREQPARLFRMVATYLNADADSPAAARERTRRAIESQVDAMCAACADPEVVAEFRRQFEYARKVFATLEVHNHFIDQMALGQLRHAVMAAGRSLTARGALAATEDVLWLRFAEVTRALRSEGAETFAQAIAARQAEHAAWQLLDAPPIIGLPDPALPERPPLRDDVLDESSGDDRPLTGQGASTGLATGRSRVAHDPQVLPRIERGDILIAKNIGPLWTPLFPLLGGLVLEGGSVLQHAAATAREYGVPAVVEVKGALRRIPDGVRVTIDGMAGTVEVISHLNELQS